MMNPSTRVPGIVHFAGEGEVILSRGTTLFQSSNRGETWERIAELPVSAVSWTMSRMRLARRFFRSGVEHVARTSDSHLIVHGWGRSYSVDLRRKRVAGFSEKLPGSRPLSLCVDGDGLAYVGEYRGNAERSPVHVFRSDDGGLTWESAYEFRGIRHVHGVFHDPYENLLWVTTGDTDAESAIWATADKFTTLHKVAGGSQQLRAIRLLFTQTHVYFGSDSPLEGNAIYRMARKDASIERLQAVSGTVFHGCKVGDHLFFSTACEPMKPSAPRIAAVWHSADGEHWSMLTGFKKDFWHMQLFQYGQVMFPGGPGTRDSLWMSPFATEGDQESFQIELSTL